MAAAVKFEVFSENLAKAVHNLHTDTIKIALASVAPVAATDDTLSDITQVASGNGYTTNGEDTTNTVSRSGGTTTVAAVDVVWTATGAGFGPFRYVVAQDDTVGSPVKPLIEYWDYGSAISLAAGETFTADFGASGLMTIA
jgi:hypothetical protein